MPRPVVIPLRSAASPRRAAGAAALALVAAAYGLVSTACAQDLFPLRPSWISLSAGSQDAALADVDRDGDLDMVSTSLLDSDRDLRSTAVLFLNDGRRLQRFPGWQSELGFLATAVALGDIDRDDNIDAVFGGTDGLFLFRGDGSTFDTRAAWSLPGSFVADVALADVDRDGDLDLLVAYDAAPSALYLNTSGAFADTTAWTAPAGLDATSLTLGDVNGDGQLDLLLAGAGKALFTNTAGDFGTAPAWELLDGVQTTGVALGDVDADGSLDLVSAHSGAASAWYRNIGGTFDSTPAWESAAPYEFTSVTLGDVQLDGDLDVVFGDATTGSKLFLNVGGNMETTPAWEAITSARAAGILLGDLNADGALDIVCANGDAPTFAYESAQLVFSGPRVEIPGIVARDFALGDVDEDGDLDVVVLAANATAWFRNDAGTLGSTPAWTGPAALDAALGDTDNDGDLDLVLANGLQPNTLWAFDSTLATFGDQPAWEAERAEGTVSIALGDTDSDGLLDLLCGNHRAPSRVWANESGRFAADPLWSSLTQLDSTIAVFGDVNRDGWLDIVLGSPDGTHRFLNDRNRIETEPSWSLQFPEDTSDIELGDMDGDGDLDLLCGNDGGPSTLHRNVNGAFEQSSAWLPEGYFGRVQLSLADVDADGDLDLFSAGDGLGEGIGLYLNNGSGLEDLPSWEEEGRPRTRAVASGDLDADGDTDALFGQLDRIALRQNRTAPATGFDPVQDHARLPNEPAQLRNVRVVGSGNIRNIDFVAYDAEGDSIWVVAEYQEWGRATNWLRVVSPGIVPPGPGIAKGPFRTGPGGVPGSIVWDLATLPFGTYHLSLRLRTISHPARAGVTQIVPVHLTDVGTLLSRKPFLQFGGLDADSTLVLAAVTIGDTVESSFKILNVGTETLRVDEMNAPFSGDLLFDVEAPFTIAAGSARNVKAVFAPRKVWDEVGRVAMRCNDPTRPFTGFDVYAPSLNLSIRTQVLSVENPVPLAQPLTIQVLPAAGVVLEAVTLFQRWRGLTDFAQIEMRQLPGETEPDGPFLATITADNVTEVGLEFYVQVENSGIVVTDPPHAPSVLHQVDVQSPETFAVTPIQTGTSGYLSGRSIDVIADIPDGVLFDHGALYWKRGGEAVWHESPLRLFEFDTIATIPDSGVGERGVQFWVEMHTATDTLFNPPNGSAPAEIHVRVPLLKEAQARPGGRYRLVSFPLEFDAPNLLVDQLLSDGPGFGPYDPVRWRVFRYDQDALANVEFTGSRPDLFAVQPGAAFWLVSRDEHRVDTAPAEGFSISATAPGRTLVLQKGWNQFGNPYAFAVDWSLVETSTPLDPPVAFDPALGAIGDYADEPAAVLQPFDGYFVYNPTASVQTLTIPPVQSTLSTAGSAAATQATAAPAITPQWWVRLVAASDAAVDAANRFGMDAAASDGHDAFDAPEPPPAPGDWVQLAFVRDGAPRRRDVRALADGQAWDVEVRAATRGTHVRVSATDLQQLPANWVLRVVDLENSTSTDASGPAIFAFGPDQPYRLRVLAGTAAWVEQAAARELLLPAAFVADRVAPNPFHDAAHFRFGIPQAVPVALHIYDVRGARVATLAAGTLPAGYHVRVWDGRDHTGRSAANGVYFARLRAGDRDAAWRLVLMR